MKAQASQIGRRIGRHTPTALGVWVGSIWLLGLGLGCNQPHLIPQPEDSLIIGLGVGRTALAGGIDHIVDSLSSEPLVSVGWNGRPVPRLATEWSFTDAGKTLKLKLRRGVVFHDGARLTADVVAAQLRGMLKLRGYNRVDSIETKGDDSIIVHMRERDAFFLGELSKANIKVGKADEAIGTGPFVIRSREPEVVLESFANYHLGRPSLQKVIVKSYETPRASWAAMMRGDVSMLYELSRDAVDFVEAGSRLTTYSFPRPYYIPIVFNVRHPILGRREVRRAINEALDRAEIVRTALYNRGQPAEGPVWPYHWAYSSATRPYGYNPEAAKLRLDAAGLPLVSSSHDAMPSRFRFRCFFWGEDAMFERIALVAQKQLFEIGIDAEMVPLTLDEIREKHAAGDFEAILVQLVSGRSLDWVYWFWRSTLREDGKTALSGYTAADSALDRLRLAQSDDDTRIALADLQRILYEDPPAAFLVWPETARAVSETLVLPEEEKGRDIFSNVWRWKHRTTAETRPAP